MSWKDTQSMGETSFGKKTGRKATEESLSSDIQNKTSGMLDMGLRGRVVVHAASMRNRKPSEEKVPRDRKKGNWGVPDSNTKIHCPRRAREAQKGPFENREAKALR